MHQLPFAAWLEQAIVTVCIDVEKTMCLSCGMLDISGTGGLVPDGTELS